jgi:hypothetical protein
MVERATSFSIVAYIVVQGRTYEGFASIVVLDRSEPPQEPPWISISYPTDDGKQNLVGEGTLLTIIGNVQAGSNPIQKIQILEGSNVLQEWPAQPGSFRVDLSSFGQLGRKVIRVRVTDTAGLYNEQQITIINDDQALDSAAREFLRKYSCAGDGGTVRMGNLSNGPYSKPIKVYINTVQQWKSLVQQACDFWTKYTAIQFEITTFTDSAESPGVVIADYTNENKSVIAETFRGYITDPHEIDATVRLYKGWLSYNDDGRVIVIEHELGHAVLTAAEVTELGSYFIMNPVMTSGGKVIPPSVQRAIQLLYSNPPGWLVGHRD